MFFKRQKSCKAVFFKRQKSLVGLDIGSSAVKAVELRTTGNGYKVAAVGSEPVPPDSIVDGAIIDGSVVSDSIRKVFENNGIRTKEVAASLSGNAVIVKKITLPLMSETELAESIYWEAEQYIPFDIQDVNLDYQVLDSGPDGDDRGTMDVLLVAAKKEKIADYTGVISQAGRVPVVVDVDAFALQNAYETNYGIDREAVVVLLNAGASAINIIQGDQSVFTRDISIGGNAYTEALQKELNLTFEDADQLKKGVPVDGATFEDADPVVRAVSENLLLEIQKTFDFFKATAASDRIDQIVLSGGASRAEGFAEALAERFESRVERFDPFRQLAVDGKKITDDVRAEVGPDCGRGGGGSRSDGWTIDDSHQSARGRARSDQAAGRDRDRATGHDRVQCDRRGHRGRHGLVVLDASRARMRN